MSEFSQKHLIEELQKRSIARVFLAFVEEEAAGLAICFEGFSTFACRPLLNIHDFAVSPRHRRKGVGKTLMHFVESYAKENGFCKLTLEVLEGNQPAKDLYTACGFEGYELAEDTGKALLWQKKL